MKKYLILFIVFLFTGAFAGPGIASTSGADSIELLANITTFGGLILSIVFGVLAAKNSSLNKGMKGLVIFLVFLAAFAGFIAAALMMGL